MKAYRDVTEGLFLIVWGSVLGALLYAYSDGAAELFLLFALCVATTTLNLYQIARRL
jgi:hypothetical protein